MRHHHSRNCNNCFAPHLSTCNFSLAAPLNLPTLTMLSNTRLAASMALRGVLSSCFHDCHLQLTSYFSQPNQHLPASLSAPVHQPSFLQQHQSLPLQRSHHRAMHKGPLSASLASLEEKSLCQAKRRKKVPCNMPCASQLLELNLRLGGMANILHSIGQPWIKSPIGPVKALCGP